MEAIAIRLEAIPTRNKRLLVTHSLEKNTYGGPRQFTLSNLVLDTSAMRTLLSWPEPRSSCFAKHAKSKSKSVLLGLASKTIAAKQYKLASAKLQQLGFRKRDLIPALPSDQATCSFTTNLYKTLRSSQKL